MHICMLTILYGDFNICLDVLNSMSRQSMWILYIVHFNHVVFNLSKYFSFTDFLKYFTDFNPRLFVTSL